MNLWQQNYDPAGNIWLSSLIASLPILFFFFALIKLKLKGYVAASWTVVIALAVALLFYKMPVDHALASVVYGFFYGLWPIAWIIIAAVFVYKISVKTGQFDIIRSSILSITPDQRLQMLIVGFCFGAFLEGAAGFGAPVAITAALLVGLGFNPLYAAGLCLIVNTAPVAFGAMGIPILVAGQVTGLDSFEIGQMVGRQLPFLTIIVLFWIMAIMDGWRGDPVCRAVVYRLAENEALSRNPDLWQHAERAGVADLLHRHGAGVRVYLELFRAFFHAGVSAGAHRQRLHVLLAVPRLAGCLPDRFGYLI